MTGRAYIRPALTEEQAKRLLIPHEVVRDPLHGDIRITALERTIIDTPAFQRLRWLNQLGPTYLVYPGAVHNRFLHSIGTLQWAEQLVQVVNRNCDTYSQDSLVHVDSYPHFLVRLCALLHDVAHMPYGHTLEDEGNLADPEWDDVDRAKMWLGTNETTSPFSVAPVITQFLLDFGVESEAAERVISDIQRHLLRCELDAVDLGKEDVTGNNLKNNEPKKIGIMDLEYPFVVDLVGNTLCADLLDYVERDMYFCGLRERSGDRVVSYLAVVRVQPSEEKPDELVPSNIQRQGKGRVVLLLYRYEREHLATGSPRPVHKSDIVSEAIDLLRRRFALAEKVYFHRTKLAASALLISAMGSASLEIKAIYNMSDTEFLDCLLSDANPRTKYLATAYKTRRLYKPGYRINFREERDNDQPSRLLWRGKYPDFRKNKWRRQMEETLEMYAKLPEGSVSIYCPTRDMNLKEFEVLVQTLPGSEIKKLGAILDPSRRSEMEAINQRFRQLWSFQVFVDPLRLDVSQHYNPAVKDFNALCEGLIGFPNDIGELRGKGRPLLEQLGDRVVEDWQREYGKTVPHYAYLKLINVEYRERGPALMSEMRKVLEAEMGPSQQELPMD